jgi:DNA anti-recombination protein RmuC
MTTTMMVSDSSYSSLSSSSLSSAAAFNKATNGGDAAATTTKKRQAQQELRRDRNREHAKKSRLRKKSLTDTLEQSMSDLKTENATLRNQAYDTLHMNKEQVDAMIQVRLISPTRAFLRSFQEPQHRVLDEATVSFLHSLRKNIPGYATSATSAEDSNNVSI